MAAIKVNATTTKKLSLKKLAKQRKRIGTGDGGLITDKTREVLRK